MWIEENNIVTWIIEQRKIEEITKEMFLMVERHGKLLDFLLYGMCTHGVEAFSLYIDGNLVDRRHTRSSVLISEGRRCFQCELEILKRYLHLKETIGNRILIPEIKEISMMKPIGGKEDIEKKFQLQKRLQIIGY